MWPGGTLHVVVGTLKISLDRLKKKKLKKKGEVTIFLQPGYPSQFEVDQIVNHWVQRFKATLLSSAWTLDMQ